MDEKTKLPPEEAEQKIENIRKNLMTRVYAIYREDRTGSIETRKSYLGAESRFCGFLAEHYRLQNIKNVEGRHLRAYVEQLQDEGKSAAYIDATLSGIRFYHRRSGSKNRLPENKDLHLEKRHPGKLNRAWLTSEIVKACEIAHEMGDQDVMMAILLGANFGLRVSEIVTVRINQLENALNHRQFHVPRGKGGQKRDIPVDTKNQVMLLKQLLNYAKKQGKNPGDYLLCDNHEHSVLKEKNRLIRWMNNHRKKFIDPVEFGGDEIFPGQ